MTIVLSFMPILKLISKVAWQWILSYVLGQILIWKDDWAIALFTRVFRNDLCKIECLRDT
jgi:hypothetical protein